MLIRIAIVDDQPEARELLRQDLLVRAPAGTSIACFDSSESFLSGFVPGDDSLIFLDICMKGMNGIEAAERVRKRSARCLIVFLTSSREYAFDAFPIHPFDYLVKPYQTSQLEHVLSGAIRLMEESEPQVEIRMPRQTVRMPHGQIAAIASHGHTLDVFTVSGARLISLQTFAELEADAARRRAVSALQPGRARQHGRSAQTRRRQHHFDERHALSDPPAQPP